MGSERMIHELRRLMLCEQIDLDASKLNGSVYDGSVHLSRDNRVDPDEWIRIFNQLEIDTLTQEFHFNPEVFVTEGCRFPKRIDLSVVCSVSVIAQAECLPEEVGRKIHVYESPSRTIHPDELRLSLTSIQELKEVDCPEVLMYVYNARTLSWTPFSLDGYRRRC